ncbi:lipoate--protein ligase family protein [Methanosarcinales archaeon]|nr:MAG: lipoate--protein ligase family protein [Methanosarcinales archaeon]RLG27599.1 MAG: lipoate--protein ligase family protein [Methanosarcinales archaeon]
MGTRTGLHKSRGGLIRCEVTLEDDRIMDIILSGDFFLYPEDALLHIADALRGLSISSRELLVTTIHDVYSKHEIISPGCEPIDFVSAIANALKEEMEGDW